ncbi:MAG: sodium:solute symporter family protein, partial [Synergistaceae bacterium]|nr:sodium:solute symporter family protein [Synergistaceae bacterium]
SEVFTNAEGVLLRSNVGELNGIITRDDFISRYVSFTARGTLKDIGSCVSLVLGVLSTQTYMQYILSARSPQQARMSLYSAGLHVPPAGIAGIFIGMFMRANYVTSSELNALMSAGLEAPDLGVIASTIQVFPAFVMNHVPVIFRGVILGTLLITIISGSSGLLLGISAIMTEDIFSSLRFVRERKLFFSRLAIIITLIIAATISNIMPVNAINDLGFLSMTLRASVVFMPLLCALFMKGRIAPRYVLASVILAPTLAILGMMLRVEIEPLCVAMGVSVVLCIAGYRRSE